MTPPLASLTVPTSEVLFAICALRNNGLNGRMRQASSALFMVGSYCQLLAGQENLCWVRLCIRSLIDQYYEGLRGRYVTWVGTLDYISREKFHRNVMGRLRCAV